MNLDDLNIVAIPAQPKAQPTKKKKNNKYERRRRKAQQARQGKAAGGRSKNNEVDGSISMKMKETQATGDSENQREVTPGKVAVMKSEKDVTTSNESETLIPTNDKKNIGSSTPKKDNDEESDSSSKPSKIESISKSQKIKTENTEKDSKAGENVENVSPPMKASRRNRPQAKEDPKEQEDDHAKYMAEFHARPMELDRRSGARSSIRISKDSSHLFVVADDWESLQVNPRMIQTLTSRFNLAKPTAIQTKTIQAFQTSPNNNVLVHSETGSGKTLAYLLPILQSMAFGDGAERGEIKRKSRKELGTKCLILCPTRELASQTLTVLERLCQANFAGWIVPGCLLGGDSRQSEKSRLRKGLAVIVATPGRLLDHLQKTQSLLLNLKGKLQWLVLDECDRLLDMGLGDQVRQIVQMICANEASRTQSWWRSVLVSATVTQSVQDLAKERMLCGNQEWIWVKGGNRKSSKATKTETGDDNDDNGASSSAQDESIEGYSESTPHQLAQFHLTVTAKLRLSSLVAFLVQRISKGERVVVFMATCASVDYHWQLFETMESIWDSNDEKKEKGLFGRRAKVFKLHGSVPHSKRNHTLRNFEAMSSSAILLTTDVSARGLNLSGVDWAVQYDPPCEIADYVHRVGRVARAGKAGHSLLFLLPSERGYLDVLKTKRIDDLTALSLSSTLGQAASICKDLTKSGLKNGGGGYGGKDKSNHSFKRENNRLGEYFSSEIQRLFEECVVQDDIQAKKAWKETKRKRKAEAPKKKEGVLVELARDAFLSFLRSYSTKKESAVRSIFSARALHLGHVARSFALKEPPKSLVSKHRQNQKQQQDIDDEEANKPKSLAFHSSTGAAENNISQDDSNAREEVQEMRVFKRPKYMKESGSGKAKNAKALLLANAFKMQNNLLDAM